MKMKTAVVGILILTLALGMSLLPSGNADNTLKIGMSTPLTGASAFMGYSNRDGAKLAVETINKAGGVRGTKIELLIEDDRVIPAEGVNIAEKHIVRDKVSVVMVTVGSAVSLAVLPVADRYQVPLFSTGTADAITSGNSAWVFANAATNSMIAEKSVDYVATKVKPRPGTAAIIYENTDYGLELKDFTVSNLRKFGIKVVATETHLQGAVDFRALLTKIKNADPAVLFVLNKYTEGAQIVRQARDLNFSPLIVGSNGHAVQEYIDIGGKAVENVIIPSLFETSIPTKKGQQFVAEYQKKYNKDPDWFAATAYDAIFTIADAFRRAKSANPTAIRDELKKTKGLELIDGPLSFDENGRANRKVIMTKVENGKRVIVDF